LTKDIKRSVRDKYNRRLQWLSHAIEQYEIAASERIEHGGKIQDRDEVDAILEAIEPLKRLLPEESVLDEETNRRLCELFNIEYVPIKKDT
jgi:hypothetical protein